MKDLLSGTGPLAVGDLIIPVADSNLDSSLFLPVFAATRTDSIRITYCNPSGAAVDTTSGDQLSIDYYAVSLPMAAP